MDQALDVEKQLTETSRWSFLEEKAEPFAVVTRAMEVIYLNAPARTLVPARWFRCRCWEVFPVGDQSCPSRCAAVKAVSHGTEVVYCEETIFPNGTPLHLAVAVIPLGKATPIAGWDGARAVLLFRAVTMDVPHETFRASLIERATQLQLELATRVG